MIKIAFNKIEVWQRESPNNKTYFRPKGESSIGVSNDENDENGEVGEDEDEPEIKIIADRDNSLVFVYQAEWQKRLLCRYGNELSLLDATCKTTRYALPLFFLVVKTNVDYQIVATFVCEGESTVNIF